MLRHRLLHSRRTLATLIELSTLRNGVRVVTDSTPGHFSAMGAYVGSGSRYETAELSGLSHLLDRMAWKSTQRRLGKQMVEDLARLGGNYMCGAQREVVMYQALVFNPDRERMFERIAETLRMPVLAESEFHEAVATASYELDELAHKYDLFLPEKLHEAAYGRHTLGMPMYGSHEALALLQHSDLLAFHRRFYTPQLTVVAFVGVPHSDAVRMAEAHLGDWAAAAGNLELPSKELAVFQGGLVAMPYQEPRFANLPSLVHMQVGFETEGLLSSDLYALALLQKLLGGGLLFLAGGPGKGMFLRLFRVLNQYPFVENCTAFNHAHTDLGLFGIHISCYVDHGEHMAQIAAHELAKVMETDAARGAISDLEFARAKNQLVAALLMNVESKLAALEDIGRQVQCQGFVTPVHEMVDRIQALSIKDLQTVAAKVFTAKDPAVVYQGDLKQLRKVPTALKAFGLGRPLSFKSFF